MAKLPSFLKNKYVLTIFLFIIYVLFLDDTDIFSLVHNLNKRSEISTQKNLTTALRCKLFRNVCSVKEIL